MGGEIAAGTPCYLTGLRGAFARLDGRVVEVTGTSPPPAGAPAHRPPWYTLASCWISAEFPGRVPIAPRACLRPLVPPDSAAGGAALRDVPVRVPAAR